MYKGLDGVMENDDDDDDDDGVSEDLGECFKRVSLVGEAKGEQTK